MKRHPEYMVTLILSVPCYKCTMDRIRKSEVYSILLTKYIYIYIFDEQKIE